MSGECERCGEHCLDCTCNQCSVCKKIIPEEEIYTSWYHCPHCNKDYCEEGKEVCWYTKEDLEKMIYECMKPEMDFMQFQIDEIEKIIVDLPNN